MELFKTPDHAAMFALRYSSQQYAQSPMSKQMQRVGATHIGQGKGLVALDGAAQAGMIRARLARLDDLQRACVVATFVTRTDECPCCFGTRLTDEYKTALLALSEWARTLIRDEVDSQRLRFGIVRSFFDRKESMTKLAKSIGMPARTVLDQKNKIWPHLATLNKNAQAMMGDLLADLCGPDDA
jgi:hypothetical protein